MAKIKISRKPLYKKQNRLFAYFTKPHFKHTKITQNHAHHVSFWDKYKEILAPIGALVGAFLLYISTRGALMSGDINFNVNSGSLGLNSSDSVMGGPGLTTPSKPSGTANTDSLIQLIIGFTNWLLPYVVVVAVIMIIYAGVLMLTAAGNDDQISKGKTILVWTIIALFIVFAAYAIVNTVVNFY